MKILQQYGWTDIHQTYFAQYPQKELLPGRVVSIRGFKYEVIAENGIIETELSGRMMFANSPEQLPRVGDWVLFMDYTSMGYIIDLFPRKNALTRKNPGTKTEVQVLATNIDAALIVQGLDRDFNVNRVERYLVQIAACDIPSVVILNKADLVDDPQPYRDEVAKLQRDILVHVCSTVSGLGVEELRQSILAPRKTYILVGSSGVGKSSLINTLVNSEKQKVNATSDFNQKGKHTTTTRDLFLLSNGSLLIDSPGMREFGLTGGDDANATDLFPAIGQFASACRFTDCKHMDEAGCAVLHALEKGELDPVIYQNFVKLVKEQRRFEINAEDKKRLGKKAGRMSREASAHRKKYKF
jgi:ribosome biogenesis GTPase / thiamine phosphate phosphatase